MWDVRRSAGCKAWRKSWDAGGETRRGTRTWRRTQRMWESRFPVGGVAFRRIGDEGLKGERDVKRCRPTLHGCVLPSREEGRQRWEKVPAHVARLGTVFSPWEPGEEVWVPEETEENRLLQLLKFAGEGRVFAGTGPQGRGVSLIVCARAVAVERRAHAPRRGPNPGSSARENAVEVVYAWVRGRGVR
jgi:hypothetical protein